MFTKLFIFSILVLILLKKDSKNGEKKINNIRQVFKQFFCVLYGNLYEPVLQRCVWRMKELTKVRSSATQWSHM